MEMVRKTEIQTRQIDSQIHRQIRHKDRQTGTEKLLVGTDEPHGQMARRNPCTVWTAGGFAAGWLVARGGGGQG